MKVGMSPAPPSGDRGNGMLSTRRGSTIAAIAAGILAALILIAFLSAQSDDGGTAKTQNVLAARNLLAKGASGDSIAANGLFQVVRVKSSDVKAGAISDPGALRGQVLTRQVFAGEQLTSADFRGKEQHGVIDQIGGRERAIAVPVDKTHGLVGNLEAGQHVDVYGSYTLKSRGGGDGAQVIRQLLKNVTVLQVGEGDNGGDVVLNVPEEVAGKVALTADYGKVWLTLRPGAGAQSDPVPTTDSAETVLMGVDSRRVTQAFDAIGGATNSNLSKIAKLLIGVGGGR